MRRAGRRVLVDTMVRRKIARDEVGPVKAWRRDDSARIRNAARCCAIGLQARYILGAIVDGERAPARDEALYRATAKRGQNRRVGWFRLGRPSRTVHRKQTAVALHFERPRPCGIKSHQTMVGGEDVQHDMARSEGGMAAEVDLDSGVNQRNA